MAITAFSASKSINLAQDSAGVVTISAQADGFLNGLFARATGVLNGGATTAIGLANTVADVGLLVGGVAIANKTDFSKSWPVIGVRA